jgi:hypothetical protein
MTLHHELAPSDGAKKDAMAELFVELAEALDQSGIGYRTRPKAKLGLDVPDPGRPEAEPLNLHCSYDGCIGVGWDLRTLTTVDLTYEPALGAFVWKADPSVPALVAIARVIAEKFREGPRVSPPVG